MADKSGKDGKEAFRDAAHRNKDKVIRAIRNSMAAGKTQVPAHDAKTLLAHIRGKDRSISSDSAHESLVADIVRQNGWTYRPRSAKK